jgi:molecular chaperone GrpE
MQDATATATAEPAADEPANGAAATSAPADDGVAALEQAKALVDDADTFASDPEAARLALAESLALAEAGLAALQARALAADAAAQQAATEATATAREQYLRLSADFENFRRRTAEEKADANARARGDVISSLLPLVDNFELARAQVKAETEAEQKINSSYQGLYRQLVDLLKAQGVEAVPTEGHPFDPELHEAIAREASDEVADGTVLQEFRKGFMMAPGDRLLRPAMVKVSYNDAPVDTPAAETTQEEGEAKKGEQEQEGQA